ncbi:hypothetical protein [Streptomyces sp. H27-C3]|uniref:hypothetical protein n=1 Tax=Streptomyces sp. H27-C3 TaxID=3046305 RepID=UPI0024BBA99B|nr:hypothetical protein [Streptomyces sp. H27-C3]MDJ0460601.1 hypothetical protein [Streptomyces sp. H27-C3]
MRRTAAAIITVLLAASLTGCGSSTNDKAATKAPPTPTVSKDDQFLEAVHAATFDSWATEGPTDEELLEYPPQWCTELEAGHSVEYLFGMSEANLYPIGEGWGTKKVEANELLVMGVKTHCPKLRVQVTDELRDSGEF